MRNTASDGLSGAEERLGGRLISALAQQHVHHTDAEREWVYDRKSSIGMLDKALDEAQAKGWTIVDTKTD
jgi:hypothetical protein